MVKAPEIQSSDQNQQQQHQLANKKINQLSMATDVSTSTPTTSSTLSQQQQPQHQSTSPILAQSPTPQQPSIEVAKSVTHQHGQQSGSTIKTTINNSETNKSSSNNSGSSTSSNHNKNVSKPTGKQTGSTPVQSLSSATSSSSTPIISVTTTLGSLSVTSTAAIAVVAPTTRSGGGAIGGNISGNSINVTPLTNIKLNGQVLSTNLPAQPQIMSAHAQRVSHAFQHLTPFPSVPPPGGGGAPWSATIVEPAFHFGPGFEPQTRHYCPTHSQPSEHVVFFHVNPGVSVSFQVGATREIVRGELVIFAR